MWIVGKSLGSQRNRAINGAFEQRHGLGIRRQLVSRLEVPVIHEQLALQAAQAIELSEQIGRGFWHRSE